MGEGEVVSSQSRSGHPVLKLHGRWLASPFDPIREAEQWAQRLPFAPERFEAVAVLGASCGYHLEALHRRNKKLELYVFEADPRVTEWTRKRMGEPTSVHWMCPRDLSGELDERGSEVAGRLLSSIYGVTIHPSITSDQGEFYSKVLKLLLARDEEGWMEWRKSSQQATPLQLKKERENPLAALSIKDLITEPANPFEIEDCALQLLALQELIR